MVLLNKKNKRIWQILILFFTLAIVAGYITVPPFKSMVNGIFMLFSSMNVDIIKGYIGSYGIYAVIISFALMVFSSIIAPLPAFLITFANAALFGWWQGAILSWSSAMAGAALCFFIARIYGREAVEKLTNKFSMKSFDVFFERYGKNTILICRLLPFVSFDFVSYAAGLTSMAFVPFFIATGIGQLPATIVYSYVGGMLTGSLKTVITAIFIMFALAAFASMLKKIYSDKHPAG